MTTCDKCKKESNRLIKTRSELLQVHICEDCKKEVEDMLYHIWYQTEMHIKGEQIRAFNNWFNKG